MKKINIINDYIKKAKNLANNDYSNPKEVKDLIDNWVDEVSKYLKKSFPEISDDFVDEIQYVGEGTGLTYMLNRDEWAEDPSKLTDYLKSVFHKKGDFLSTTRDYLNVSDYAKNGVIPILKSMQDKEDFVLECLYLIYNDNFYSIKQIFDVNKIQYPENEPVELSEDLKRRGYVSLDIMERDRVKITVKGVKFIERKSKKLSKSQRTQDINQRIDLVIYELKKLGVGQEILFDEIEELREVSNKLNQKSWSQLIKGRVIDLTLESIISKDIAKMIYETLVDNNFKLLS